MTTSPLDTAPSPRQRIKEVLPEWLRTLLRWVRRLPRRHWYWQISRRLRRRFSDAEWQAIQATRVTTFPEYVFEDLGYVLWKALHVAGIAIGPFSVSKDYDICVNFQDTTHAALDIDAFVKEIYAAQRRPVPEKNLNFGLDDISKRHVGEVFEEVFGYPLNVDPVRHQGPAVRKSDLNAAHDGVVISCPITPEEVQPGASYTRLIDNAEGENVLDIRLAILGCPVEFIYLKRRPVADRFSNTNRFVTIESRQSHISSAEAGLIATFCTRIGLDYGELDCVRDRCDGKLYILDVNKTPAGPPNGLPKSGQAFAIEELAAAFCRNFILRERELRG